MSVYILPAAFALFAWWFSTGFVLFLNHLPVRTYRWSLAAATLVLAASVYGLTVSSQQTTAAGAMLAFTQALLVWGWIEMTYLMGFITGAERSPCPTGCSESRRFRLALRASLHHELVVAGVGCWIVITSWGAPNQTGTWTFVTLWLMRWSAKLNLFFGVPNVHDDWLPEHLGFLKSYIRRRPMNALFPWSVSIATLVLLYLLVTMGTQTGGEFEKTATTLVATMLALAILEHWFLVLPIKDSALWNWALRLARRPVRARKRGRKETTGDRGDAHLDSAPPLSQSVYEK